MKSIEDYLAENKKASDERQNVYNPINYLNCKDKVKRSLENVKNRAKELELFYYKCNICGSYHLTKQQTYESTMED